MRTDDPHDNLERLVGDRLRRLPVPKAPASLHGRVMTAVRATSSPAVRPWSVWPRVWQTTFVLGLVTIAAVGVAAWSIVAAGARGEAGWQIAAQTVVSTTDAVGALREALSTGVWSFAALLTSPVVLAIGAVVSASVFAFLGLGAWLRHLALPPGAWLKGSSR